MASVNDLILESNVRERLYPAMPFKILQIYMKTARACLKNHSRNLHAPLCGRFHPNSVAVARYGALIRAKSPTNCDAHLAESLFQTRSNRYAYASCFSGNIFPKRKRISGPQYISCQKKATGKFMKVVWSHTATNWEPAFLNKIVAIKLMIGHIMQMIITEIAIVIAKGLSVGVTIRNASL